MTETLNAKKNKIPTGPLPWAPMSAEWAGALGMAPEERGLGALSPFFMLTLVFPPTHQQRMGPSSAMSVTAASLRKPHSRGIRCRPTVTNPTSVTAARPPSATRATSPATRPSIRVWPCPTPPELTRVTRGRKGSGSQRKQCGASECSWVRQGAGPVLA